jgi:hypothetical protein
MSLAPVLVQDTTVAHETQYSQRTEATKVQAVAPGPWILLENPTKYGDKEHDGDAFLKSDKPEHTAADRIRIKSVHCLQT